MQNETNQCPVRLELPDNKKALSKPTRLWSNLPAIAKCFIIFPVTMALVGVEIELRLAPQFDVILTAAGVWAMCTWLAGNPPATKQ